MTTKWVKEGYDGHGTAGAAITYGDLLWYNDSDGEIYPASSISDQGSLSDNQIYLASRFVGIAKSSAADGETVTWQGEGTFQIDCASATFDLGDLIGGVENGDGDELEDQKCVAVSNPANAIGRVQSPVSTADTKVNVKIVGIVDGLVQGTPSS